MNTNVSVPARPQRTLQSCIAWLGCATVAVASQASFAQGYPGKLMRIVVPYPASGPTDLTGRMLAQKFSEARRHWWRTSLVPAASSVRICGQVPA